jgi:glycosyltransferase involved in cell wall biosynthesis
MKVAVLFGNPVGAFYGGISTHVNYLTKYLSTFKDINLVVVTFGEKNSTYKKNGIEFVELKRMKFGLFCYPFEIFYDLFRVANVMKTIHPDLIHIQSTSPNFSLFGLHVLRKYPLLQTVHGYFTEEFKIQIGFKKLIYRFFCAPIERMILSKIPRIIVLSPQIKDMIGKITKSKICIIPNGVDLNFIQSINPNRTTEHPSIFFLGYLTKGKGVDDLIQAVQLVKNEIKGIRLYIGGNGPYMNQLKDLVRKLDLSENVIFLGLLNDMEKFGYMKAIDVFVLPSHWESFPIVLLEAMACEKPIITTNVGGNPYAVTDGVNGFLVQPNEPQSIANKIISLLYTKDLLQKMGRESRIRSLDFNWEKIAQQTRDLYQEIMKES